jgi:superfamily II DNA or RNA helicase
MNERAIRVEPSRPPNGMELRPYQHEAIAAIALEHARVRSTLLVLATGLGKTVTFAAMARDIAASGGKTLVLAHRAELVEQAAATLRALGMRAGIEQAERTVGPLEQADAIVASVQTLQRKRLAMYARNTKRSTRPRQPTARSSTTSSAPRCSA